MATNNQAYQFRYDPPFPEELSGVEFERQTQEAVGDLGGLSQQALETAEKAAYNAQKALDTADEAEKGAKAAVKTADEAKSTADQAVDRATGAGNAAQVAQNTADQALNTAITAENKADQAQNSANAAQQTGNNAAGVAEEARQTAENAVQIAETSREEIDSMLIYTRDTNAEDINELDASGNYYIDNATLPNLPTPEKGFLTVRVNENSDRYFQTFLPESNTYVASRTAVVVQVPVEAGTDTISIAGESGSILDLNFIAGSDLLDCSASGPGLVEIDKDALSDVALTGRIVFAIENTEEADITFNGESILHLTDNEIYIYSEMLVSENGRLVITDALLEGNNITLQFEYRWLDIEDENVIWSNWSEVGGDQRMFYARETAVRTDVNALELVFDPPVTFLLDGDVFNIKVNAAGPNTSAAVTLKVDENAALPVFRANEPSRRLYTGDISAAGVLALQYMAASDTEEACFMLLNPATPGAYVASEGAVRTSNYEESAITQTESITLTTDSPNVMVISGSTTLAVNAQPLDREVSKIVTLNILASEEQDTTVTYPAGLFWITDDDAGTIPVDGKAIVNIIMTNGLLLGQVICVYEPGAILLDVMYDPDGGNGGPGNGTAIKRQSYIIPDDVPLKDENIFTGWLDTVSGVAYQPGEEIVRVMREITLVAQWVEAVSVLITLDPSGGDLNGLPATISAYKDVPYTLPADVPTFAGKVFQRWDTDPEGSGESYNAGASITVKVDTLLFAQWETAPLPTP